MAFIGFVMVILLGCGEKNVEKQITVKGPDGTEYESYQECCAAQDFQAAHQYLAKMEQAGESTYSAKDYVFKQEALFLMSQGDETSKKRIIYLLKEEEADNSRIDMLIDLAIDNDDEEFVKTLTKHYKSNPGSDILRKIVEYFYIQKGKEHLEFVQTLLNRYNKSDLLIDAAIEKDDEALMITLIQQYNGSLSFQSFKNVMDYLKSINSTNYQTVLNRLITNVPESDELLTFILSNNLTGTAKKLAEKIISNTLSLNNKKLLNSVAAAKNNKYDEIIISLLIKESKEISPRPSVGIISAEDSNLWDPDAECHYNPYDRLKSKYRNYVAEVNSYNSTCLDILGVAIAAKNQYLATRVVSLLKENIQFTELPIKSEEGAGRFIYNYGRIRVFVDSEEIKNAKATLNDAVRSGAFK